MGAFAPQKEIFQLLGENKIMHDLKKAKLTHAIKLAVSVNVGLLAATPTFAEDGANQMEEIVVTGSRIPRADLDGPSPVSIYDRTNIEQSGATSIGQMLREIPAVAGQAQSTNINNGGGGSQNISLRGLGSGRPSQGGGPVSARLGEAGGPSGVVEYPSQAVGPRFDIGRVDDQAGVPGHLGRRRVSRGHDRGSVSHGLQDG